ncbi:MAG TPA: TatD family hydrolase [Myxococcota bacterium]
MLVDSHCHLDTDRFDPDRTATIERARAAGVARMVNVGCDLASSLRSLGLAQTHADIFATVGVHPHEAKDVPADFDEQLVALAANARCVAIGECGLDYHYDHSPRDVQRAIFARQIAVAKRARKPLVLHVRPSSHGDGAGHDAFDDALDILKTEGARDVGGVFHCFTGTVAQSVRALDFGFYLSLPGVVTFKSAGELPDVAKRSPRERLLVETDAPFMAPTPHRGKRNEPAFVALTAAFVADVRGEDARAFTDATGDNARRLFGLP